MDWRRSHIGSGTDKTLSWPTDRRAFGESVADSFYSVEFINRSSACDLGRHCPWPQTNDAKDTIPWLVRILG
jgi:hypothetical protein